MSFVAHAITVAGFDATLVRLRAQGIEPEEPPYRAARGASRICCVQGHDGYRIELIESE